MDMKTDSDVALSEKHDRKSPRVIVVGAGMSGILMAIRLKKAGLHNFSVFEKADKIGGTWRENTYPGLSCDVPAHMYTYSFEPNPDWSHRFARGPEIQTYFEKVFKKYNVESHFRFNKEIVAAKFTDGAWHVETSDGEKAVAEFLITACGVLHHPAWPDIEGLDSFEGDMFHSAEWDHDVDLKGKRIGIIGTGSTSAQIVPAIIDDVAKLSVFQRTAQWMVATPDKKYTEHEKQRVRVIPFLGRILRESYTRAFSTRFANAVVGKGDALVQIETACRDFLERKVKDPELLAKLTPNYRAACKRLIVSSDFYDAIQKPNAELVTESIERVDPKGIVTSDGRLHELDILIVATGFKAHNFMRPMNLVGENGMTIDQAWANGPRGYRSVSIPGFPNLFTIVGPNSPIGNFSLIATSEIQTNYIMQMIKLYRKGVFAEISPKEEATAKFTAEVSEQMKNTIWASGCNSWYFDEEGRSALWPWTIDKFRKDLRQPDLSEYILRD